MDNNKYYTPEIEEFHVGFEYENFIISHPRNGKASLWIEFKINKLDDLFECHNDLALEGNIDAKFCRVKHLDSEDFESLKLGVVGCGTGLVGQIKDEKCLRLSFGALQFTFNLYYNNFVTITNNLTNEFLFMGVIKNKSELKKIIKNENRLKELKKILKQFGADI